MYTEKKNYVHNVRHEENKKRPSIEGFSYVLEGYNAILS